MNDEPNFDLKKNAFEHLLKANEPLSVHDEVTSNFNNKMKFNQLEEESEESEMRDIEGDMNLLQQIEDLKDENMKLKTLVKYQEEQLNAYEQGKNKESKKENAKLEMDKETRTEIRQLELELKNMKISFDKASNLLSEKKLENEGLLEKLKETKRETENAGRIEKKYKIELASKESQIKKLLSEIQRLEENKKPVVQTNDNSSKLIDELRTIEKQKNELYQAFKKSLKLCSILKRQKIHLENALTLKFTEQEFKEILANTHK